MLFIRSSRPGLVPVWLAVLGAVAFGATGLVNLQSPPPAARTRKPSPPLSSLPAPKAAGPLRILLVDDDWSSNNLTDARDDLSPSDVVFRRLVAEAVSGEASAWDVEVVRAYKDGPGVDRLLPFNLVIWYTGASYGGSADNTAVLSREDEKTVRSYLEKKGGAVVLVSPGYVLNHAYGNTWTDAPVPFLTEVAGINGFYGLAHRGGGGVVTASNGKLYPMGDKPPPESQISGVNPDGAALVFTASLEPSRTAAGAVAVAVAHPFGGGRFVYVGFTFENINAAELTPAFRLLIDAAGVATVGRTARPVAIRPAPALAPPPVAPPVAPVAPVEGRTPIRVLPTEPATVRPGTLTAQVLKDVEFDNWGFENGLAGWTKTGTAFDHQPTGGDNVTTDRVLTTMEYARGGIGGDYWQKQGYPNGYKGRKWIGTFENYTGLAGSTFGATQGEGPTGTLVSPEVQLTRNRCYFLIGGGSDASKLKVEFQIKQADGTWKTEATRTSFRNSELFYREEFTLTAFKGKTARLRIVDNGTGSWGHINVDDFRFQDEALEGISLTDSAAGRTYLIDPDFPAWGFADTHAHPAHDNGFGGRTIVGKADAPLSTTYSTALCVENHSPLGLGGLNTAFIGGGDKHEIMEGWPDFVGFPRFNSKSHQQQHVDFLKRAWQGGLRLISALAVNNMYLPSLAMGPQSDGKPYDDHSVTVRQLEDLKSLARSQSSWLEVAYTPLQARTIIAQGKCAMVLGIEVDNFGNFKVPSYVWNDNVGPANAKLVALTPEEADVKLTDRVNEYYNLGARQVTPIHYLTGTFGGAAVFRGQIALIQFAFNHTLAVKDAIARKIPYSLRDDYDGSMLAVAYFPAGYDARITGTTQPSTINAQGMSYFGRMLTDKLMNKGMLIDSEHMGYETKEDLFAIAAQRHYPIMSSHTDPAGLGYNWLGAPTSFSGSPEDKMRNFGTTNIRNLTSEFMIADEHFAKIKASGGTVGVFMLPYLKKPYQGPYGSIANDCAGSSKTWAQMYLYCLDRMELQSVALATDRGMTDFIAPRFGPNAGYMLADEELPRMKKDARQVQRLGQRNGVKYDRPMSSFHRSWYHQPKADAIDEYENDAWIAFAAIEANVATTSVPDSYYVVHGARVRNYVKGYRAINESALEQPFLNGDTSWEQAAMFCVKNNREPASLAAFAGYNREQQDRLRIIYAAILPAWHAWNGKFGNNPPIRRYRTGNRDWDFNTDGMAHYGMVPDFLQDLRNIGLPPATLTPLFRSAEDYIRMWEKAEKAKVVAR